MMAAAIPHATSAQDATPASPPEASPAATQLQQGLAQFNAGNLAQARETLAGIDPISLSKEQRQQLLTTIEQIDAQLEAVDLGSAPAPTPGSAPGSAPAAGEAPAAPAAASSADLLAQADADARQDPGSAIALYTTVIEQGGEDGRVAQARLADLLRGLNADVTRAKATLDSAEADLAAGRLDLAETKFAAVSASGVELGWFDQQRVTRGAERIAEARTAEAEAQPAADASAGGAVEAARVAQRNAADAAAGPAAPDSDLLVQARRAVAADDVREAEEASAQGYNTLAVSLLTQAAALDPDNARIREALADANNAGNGGGGAPPILLGEQERWAIGQQAARLAYDAAMNEADARREAGDFAGAADSAARAKARLEANEQFFSVAEFEARRSRATDLSIEIARERRLAEARLRERTEAERDEAQRLERRRSLVQDQEEVQNLIVQARELQKAMKYDEALVLLDQALFRDPLNWTAQLLKEVIEDSQIAVNYREAWREKRLNVARNEVALMEATTPYQDILSYPSDWPELSLDRIAGLDDTSGESPENREQAQRLRKTVPIAFEANSLESVIDYIRETTQTNIYVNWPALQDAGVDQDLPITLNLTNVAAERALELVLQTASSAAGDIDPIGYTIDSGVIRISTIRDLRRSTSTRVYDIRDLLVQVPNFNNAPSFDLSEALSNTSSGGGGGSGGSGGGGGGSGGGGLFGDSTDEDDEEEERTREEIIADITSIIQETVGTYDEWYDGGESSIRELNGNFIIKTNPENHRQIYELLTDLRETRAIQISVEARFLLVDRNFLDRFGIDVDVAWRGGNQASNGGTPFNPGDDTTTQGFSPIVVSQDSMSLTDPVAGDLGFEQFFGGSRSLALGASFIDDISVNLLVEATLANRDSISLTAPRVTFFNGQRAYVTVARQISFISDLEPVPDAAGFDITLSVVQSGVVLDVEGTISADRRYVTLTLRPSLADVIDIVDIPVIGTTNIGGTDDGEGGDNVTFRAFIQAPELEITTVRATVSVPDRGTLLVGGQRLVGETQLESGVPVLSKIPLLNRLFTNTSTTEDERTLLILIKPTILIQNEREEHLFPGITDQILSVE